VTRSGSAAVVAIVSLLLHAPPALAQTDPPRSHVEIGAGLLWDGSQSLGTKAATEATAAGSTSALFNTSTQLSGAAGFAARIGVHLTGSLVLEGDASYLKPQLRVAISADAEGGAAVTAAETMQQFTVGAKALWYLPGRWPTRFAPFAMAGGGYLRQLHEQATLAETGRFYQFGGGVNALLVTQRHFHTNGAGVRFDASALVRSRGVAFDGGSKTSPAAGVSAFVRF
jgi:hypothetical protein